MNNKNLYGIGNALVDFDFEVSDETLVKLDIEKGAMTLIDESTEQRLMEDLDGIKHVKACGGSAANTMITAKQLGANCFYSCKVACDATGDFFYEDLQRSGVATNLKENFRDLGATGKCIAMITPDAERTMNTFLGITESLSTAEVCAGAIKTAKFAYLEGYLVASSSAFEAMMLVKKIAKANGVPCATGLADVNMVRYFKPQLLEVIGDDLEILFANEQEALAFTQVDTLDEALSKMAGYAKQVVVTQGAKGAVIMTQGKQIQVDSYPVKAIDTIGAGDIFSGAYLYALSSGLAPMQAGRVACFAASRVVTKFGPRLTAQQAEEVKTFAEDFLLAPVVS